MRHAVATGSGVRRCARPPLALAGGIRAKSPHASHCHRFVICLSMFSNSNHVRWKHGTEMGVGVRVDGTWELRQMSSSASVATLDRRSREALVGRKPKRDGSGLAVTRPTEPTRRHLRRVAAAGFCGAVSQNSGDHCRHPASDRRNNGHPHHRRCAYEPGTADGARS